MFGKKSKEENYFMVRENYKDFTVHKQSFIGIWPHLFIYILSVPGFLLQGQRPNGLQMLAHLLSGP
jgi:hypothetical protein